MVSTFVLNNTYICLRMIWSDVWLLSLCVVQFYTICSGVSEFGQCWESLDSRPLPQWYDDAKFGIFIHWGVFSVPGGGSKSASEWFWRYWKDSPPRPSYFMNKLYPMESTYQEFARDFTAEFYDPSSWAEMFENSGAKYVVITSKHHDGYTLWPSKHSFSWNSIDVGPHRDIIQDLAQALTSKTKLKFGFYYSLYEWFHPLYLHDSQNQHATNLFVTQKMMPELHELVLKYQPAIVWADGDWEANDTYWNSLEFLAWLYNESPVKEFVVVNDRWGRGIPCKHGDFYTCSDHFNPGYLQRHKWENCLPIDRRSWGYRRNGRLSDYRSTREILSELVQTVSCGGNLLLNIGPSKDGMIPVIMEERLRDIGAWLRQNGEAIYCTKPWTTQRDDKSKFVWYTMSSDGKYVYAITLLWPMNNILIMKSPKLCLDSKVTLLGENDILAWQERDNCVEIMLPVKARTNNWAWCIKMDHVEQKNHN